MKTTYIAFLAVAVGFLGIIGSVSGKETGVDIPEIDALFAHWDKPGSPGCAVAVASNGELIYTRGYGSANLDYDSPITPQTVFDIGSITKQFVAASISMLEREGKLSLDDDVRKWLPELPEYEWPVTLRHMIHHTSGFRDYLNLFPLAGRGDYYPISHPQILAMMSRQRSLNFKPGERYSYSNTAYMLLAQVVQRISGQSLHDFVQERIFEPLAMTGSLMYDDVETIIPRRATGYVRDDSGHVRIVHNYNFDVPGDGQMYSTVVDLLRWDDYLHGDDKPAIHAAMVTDGTLNNGEHINYARGLVLGEYRGLRTVQHTGSSWGFRAALVRFVEPGLSISVTCNDDNSSPLGMVRKIADYRLANQLGPEPVEESNDDSSDADSPSDIPLLAPQELAEFTGTFNSAELDATYRFEIVGGDLLVRIEQERPRNVVPAGTDTFGVLYYENDYSRRPMAKLEFTRNETGAIDGLNLSSGAERDIVFVKLQ